MKRRKFMGTCAAGSLAASTVVRAETPREDDLPRLLALAAVSVPDTDRSAWTGGAPEVALQKAWESLPEEDRSRIAVLLDSLDRASGNKFTDLDPEARDKCLRAFLGPPSGWPSEFRSVRSLAVGAFYGSPVGFERAGYLPTTQFTGYARIDRYPKDRPQP